MIENALSTCYNESMDISYVTAPGSLRLDIGYGVAGFNIVRSLQRLGHSVPYDDRRSPVQLNFSQPEWYHLRENQYQIGYTPWESSELPESWPARMNACDEVWTTSPKCREWFMLNGVYKPVKIYQHGLDKVWTPFKREPKTILKFLHIGEPAPRKGGQIALDAFRAAFGDQDDVQLTIKAFAQSNIRAKNHKGQIIGGADTFKNVFLDTRVIPGHQMPSFFKEHHALVYPSYGEGFGLIPLQAIGTGMPSIVTTWWCPYIKFILPLKYSLEQSQWHHAHPGKVAKPDFDHLVWWYKELYNNFAAYSEAAMRRTTRVHTEYNWDTLTENAFKELAKRF